MCIIDPGLYDHGGQVRAVAGTRILVCPEKGSGGSRQVTVYSNRVALGSGTRAVAMILPVPNPGNDPRHINVVDTSDDRGVSSRLFDVLHPLTQKVNPTISTKSRSVKGQGGKKYDNGESTLPVERSGSYAYTVVPKFEDFRRVHGSVLPNKPSDAVMRLLSETYTTHMFSFLVCKIAAGEDAQYHPLAYTHPMMSSGARLFVPTLHYHGEENDTLLHATGTSSEDYFNRYLTPIATRGGNGSNGPDVRVLLERQRKEMEIEEAEARAPQIKRDNAFKKSLYAFQYSDVDGYDVEQDEDADFFRKSSPDFPHWDHEVYMFGVSPDEQFGRRSSVMRGTQTELDSALRKIPDSYARLIDREQAMSAFRFRRMLGNRFANGDVTLLAMPMKN